MKVSKFEKSLLKNKKTLMCSKQIDNYKNMKDERDEINIVSQRLIYM